MTKIIIHGLKILVGKKWLTQQALLIESGRIKKIFPAIEIKKYLPAQVLFFSEKNYLVPGFIDLHIHGAAGYDVMDADAAGLQSLSIALAQEGVTGFLATTMTSSTEHIERVLQVLANEKSNLTHAQMLGVHLEGPFISKEKAGAQWAKYCLEPDIHLLKCWQKKFNEIIKVITIAPELVSAEKFIHELSALNIIASLGHTDATYEQTCNAMTAGAQHATHLFNAMRGVHQREPGASGALLIEDKIKTEIIVDGIHLHPAIVKLIYKMKGTDNLFLVTDAIRAKCLGDGQYELGGRDVSVVQGRATLADGTLAGSTLTMPQAIKNMMQFTQCELFEAVQMVTQNPARALKLEARKGFIAEDMEADLVVLSDKLEVQLTLCAGQIIYDADVCESHAAHPYSDGGSDVISELNANDYELK